MKADFNGDLRRRMEEAVLLPVDHPARQELHELASAHGERSQREWCAVQNENEQLLDELQRISAPPGLKDRLLLIPAATPRRSRVWMKSMLAAAAVLAVITTVVVSIVLRPGTDSFDQSIAHVASLVAADHTARPHLTVLASNPREAIENLQPNAPFRVDLTTTPGAATLVGGRICSFDEGPLVYTRWKGPRGDISMYQLRLADFALPANLPPRAAGQNQADDPGECRVRMWSDDHFAYAIVVDGASADTGL